MLLFCTKYLCTQVPGYLSYLKYGSNAFVGIYYVISLYSSKLKLRELQLLFVVYLNKAN